MAPFDLVLLFLFGGITIGAIVGEDHSFAGAISAVFTIGLMHVFVSWAKSRFPAIGRIVDGTPVIVYERGHWHRGRMQALRLTEQDNHGGSPPTWPRASLRRLRMTVHALRRSVSWLGADESPNGKRSSIPRAPARQLDP
jgi:hypothetical protein